MPRTLEERLTGADPEPWKPEEAGDYVFGEVESIDQREGDYGEYDVVTLLTDNGDVLSVAIWGTVLQKKFAAVKAEVGDNLGFKFLGERTPKKAGGKDYKDWNVFIQRAVKADAPSPEAATGGEFADDDQPDEA